MKTTRRGFLGFLSAAAVGLTLSAKLPGIAPSVAQLAKRAEAAILRRGDLFTIAGCYAVNPATGAETGVLQQFVVTQDATRHTDDLLTEFHPRLRDVHEVWPAVAVADIQWVLQGDNYECEVEWRDA